MKKNVFNASEELLMVLSITFSKLYKINKEDLKTIMKHSEPDIWISPLFFQIIENVLISMNTRRASFMHR